VRNTLAIFRKVWLYAFLLLAAAYCVYFGMGQLHQLDRPLQFSAPAALTVIVMQLSFWLVYSWLWSMLTAKVAGTKLGLWESFRQQNLLMLGKYLPGKVWGMLARGAAMRQRGISTEGAVVATCTDQLLVFHAALIVSAALYWWLTRSAAAAAFVALSLCTLGLAPLLLRLAFVVYRYLTPTGARQMSAPFGIPIYLAFLSGHCLGWLINGLLFSGIYYAFSNATPSLSALATLVLANTIGVTIGFLAFFAPGGIGVREAATSGLLLTAMPLDQAIMLTVLFRLWLLSTDLLVGIPALLAARTKAAS